MSEKTVAAILFLNNQDKQWLTKNTPGTDKLMRNYCQMNVFILPTM